MIALSYENSFKKIKKFCLVVFVKAVPPELVLMGGDGKEISVGREQSTRGETKGILGCSRD